MKRKAIARVLLCCLLLPLLAYPCHGERAIRVHKNSEKMIALTFDDGPHPKYTDEILEILAEYDVKATFFCVGQNVKDLPDVAKRVQAAGHEIGNHTFSHPKLQTITPLALARELEETADVLQTVLGIHPTLFRPPEGVVSEQILTLSTELSLRPVLWSIDTRDWAHTPADSIVRTIERNLSDGDIILFHDYIAGRSPTPDALRRILPKLLAEGYRPVTVSELLQAT